MATHTACREAQPTPHPVRRPRLAKWVWDRDLNWRKAGAHFGLSHEAVRRYCLPFGHPGRVRPDELTRARIAEKTGGEVPADSFDEPIAREAAA